MSDVLIGAQEPTTSQEQRKFAAANNRRWRIDLTGWGFVLPFLLFYALFLVWPVFFGLRMSFFNWSLSGKGMSDFLGLANYQEMFADANFWSSLGVTLLFTLISTPILVVLALALALLVNRAIPAQWLFRTIFFAPFVLPVSVVALLWNWLYQPGFGLINGVLTAIGFKEINWLSDPNVAMWSVVILTVWWTVGFNFILYLAGMQQIPQELNESATIDGASTWDRIRYVTIPLLSKTTTMIVILQVIASLQLFQQAFLLFAQSGGPNFAVRTLVQYIYEAGFTSFRVGFASAVSYVFFLVILIVSIIQFFALTRQRSNV